MADDISNVVELSRPRLLHFSGRIRSLMHPPTAGVVTLDTPIGEIYEARFRPARLVCVFDLLDQLAIGRQVSGRVEIAPDATRGEIVEMSLV